ncbi:MAG: cell envelope integrity protein TolA [Gammaproteobacteria bacterium]|nr:cell envelope integrity protein TolA [Gammaproteobacteria bacterium]
MIRERLRRIGSWTRAALFTLFIHGVIIYLILFGLSIHQEKLEAEGRPVQAVVVDQLELDRNKEEEKRKLEELERKRKEEELRLAEEKRRLEEEQRLAEEQKRREEEQRLAKERRLAEEQERIEEERKRRESILSNCEKLVLEEEKSGEVNHDLDGLCEKERQALKEQRAREERQREEERQRLEEEKQRKAEEEQKRQEEAERKRKAEEDRKQQEEAERKRKEAAERLLAEQKLKEQLAAEQEARLAAQTEKAAANALSAAAGRIRSSIEANWRRPGASLRGLKVVIELRVGRNGEVQKARIVESSGDDRFDESAELAVQKASPLPIPKEPEYYDHIKEFRIEFNPDE